MAETERFVHFSRGVGRPQIVLVGNGLEYKSGQNSWNKLIDELTVHDCQTLDEEGRRTIPFPLLYELLSSHYPAPAQLSRTDIIEEEKRLANAMRSFAHKSNPELDILPSLSADHIMTTNYSYCIEAAFSPQKNYMSSKTRSKDRFNLNQQQKREVNYRMHTGYISKNRDGTPVGIWHIHGECTVPLGIVLGHDRYGRLLSRIESICDSQTYTYKSNSAKQKRFTSWPELFLYGDVYIIGFGFSLCEFDLWWLLRRKQREHYSDGKVYFYDNGNPEVYSTRNMLLKAHGVIINPGVKQEEQFDVFYQKALSDIITKIKKNKCGIQ